MVNKEGAMKIEAYNSAIAASAVLQELMRAPEHSKVLPADTLAQGVDECGSQSESDGRPGVSGSSESGVGTRTAGDQRSHGLLSSISLMVSCSFCS